MPLPLVTFVTCTFNSDKLLKKCLDSVKNLDYPQNKIEVLIIDGFSKDYTIKIARRYSFVKVIQIKTDGPEIATAIGYQKARGDYVVNFPSDNVILDRMWLHKMIEPLEENKNVVASETWRYSYVRKDSMINRYYSLFGVNDTLPLYFNKRDRATYYETKWHLKMPAVDKGDYFLVKFTPDNLPTVGANGFVIRRKFARIISKNPNRFFHMDTCLDLVKKGYNTFAFVKIGIWHRTAEDVLSFLRKRKRYVIILYFRKLKIRRYHIFDSRKDKLKLIVFIFLSLTIVEPLFRALRGYLVKRDHAWFLHPIICFVTVINYFYTALIYFIYEKRFSK